MKEDKYFGVYDHKESETFRPTIEKRIHKDYPVSKTITTREDSCCCLLASERERESGIMNLRIRKLTPNECIRLMAFENEDERAMREIGMTDSAIYHCAGDSVVVNCWLAIVGSMLPISEEELKKIIEDYTERVKGK